MSSPLVVRLPSAAGQQPDRRRRFAGTRVVRYLAPLTALGLGASAFLGAAPVSAAQGPVELGTAGSFAILAGSGITNTGSTTIAGDLGTFPTLSQTGLGSITLTGTNHVGDAVTRGAKDDLVTAYNDAAGRSPVTNVPVELGGSNLKAGVYTSPTLGLTGTLTLDAEGISDAMFIFKAGSTLIAESNSRVLLVNGANPCNVVWQVGSSATFKTGTRFVGDVLAMTSITAQTAATFQGRLLARGGAVTLDTNTISKGICATGDGGDTTSTTLGTTSTTTDTTPTTTVTTPTTTGTTPTTTGTTPTTIGSTPTTTGTTPTTIGTTPTTTGTTPTTTGTTVPSGAADLTRLDLGPGSPADVPVGRLTAGPLSPQTPDNGTQTAIRTPGQTSSGQPAVPRQTTPSTPRTRTSLPATGGPIVELSTLALTLLVLGATATVAGRTRRAARLQLL